MGGAPTFLLPVKSGKSLGAVVFDIGASYDPARVEFRTARSSVNSPDAAFFVWKRIFDIVIGLLLLPVLGAAAFAVFFLNTHLNPGPLIYVQKRMGRHCRPFVAFKFRTMHAAGAVSRTANDPLELDRITPLGGFLRRTRIDELPQIINVLRGEMSLIGPRPDYFDYAVHYLSEVPGYRERHSVRPGISGLAQTEVGYVESTDATRRKVNADLYYIANRGFRLEAWIVWRTFAVIFTQAGA